jgi:hypothetical protein
MSDPNTREESWNREWAMKRFQRQSFLGFLIGVAVAGGGSILDAQAPPTKIFGFEPAPLLEAVGGSFAVGCLLATVLSFVAGIFLTNRYFRDSKRDAAMIGAS